jgi:hypothetical protein
MISTVQLALSGLSTKMDTSRWTIPGVAISSFFILLLLSSLLPVSVRSGPSTDYQLFYAPIAHNLLAGRGYTFGESDTTITANPPGYVLILTGLFWVANQAHIPEDTVVICFLHFVRLPPDFSCLYSPDVSGVARGHY